MNDYIQREATEIARKHDMDRISWMIKQQLEGVPDAEVFEVMSRPVYQSLKLAAMMVFLNGNRRLSN